MSVGSAVRREHVGKETVVFREGESGPDDRAYLIESGSVRLVRSNADGTETLVTRIGPGTVFGELALLEAAPRSATAICDADSSLLSIARDYLNDVLQRADPVLPYMMAMLTRRLRQVLSETEVPPPAAGGDDDDGRHAVEKRLAGIKELDAVLDEDRVVPVYQPVVDLVTGRTVGFEALLRVRGRDGSLHPPMDYIALAEEVGATGAFARRMLHYACHDAMRWGEAGPFVAVNISQRDLEGDTLLRDVAAALESSGLSPTRLELEITESALAADFEAARQYLNEFRDMGVASAIDDFGTGYASLAALAALPVIKLKIDKSFVWSYSTDPTARAIVDAVLGLAQSLGVRTTGEGVETTDHLHALRRLGCASAQGFLFAKGRTAETAASLAHHTWFAAV